MIGPEGGSDLARRVELLRRRLTRPGVNISKLADLAGITRPTIHNLRDGTRVLRPREETIAALERALGLTEARAGGLDTAIVAARVDSELRRLALLKTSARTLAKSLIRNPTVAQDLDLMGDQVVAQMERMVKESTGESELAARLALALLYVVTGRYRDCLAIAEGVAASDPQWRLSRWIASEAYRMLGEPYWDRSLEASADAIVSDDPRVSGWGRFNRAKVLDKLGQYQRAKREYELAKRTASNEPMSDFERFDMQAWCDWGLGWLQIHRAAAHHALRTFRRALSSGLQGDYGIVVWLIHGLATVLQLQGSYDEARILYRQCIRLCHAINNQHYAAWMYLGLAEAACQQGGWSAGSALARQAREVFEVGESDAPPSRDSAAALELFCGAASGRMPWATCAQGIGALPAFQGSEYLIERLSVRLLHAEATRHGGDPEQASAEYRNVHETAERRGLRLLEAHAALGLGAALLDTGTDRSRSEARWQLERVLPVFQAGHLAWATANCLLLLRAADPDPDPQRYEERLRRVTAGCLPIEAAAVDVAPQHWRPLLAFVSE